MSKSTTSTVATKTAYEGSVITRAAARAGKNPHLKGHIHEVLVKDARNLRNLLNGSRTELTRSTTAECVDLVTTKGGKVIERIQVKDVTSSAGVRKIVDQVASGKYRSVQLVGSEETTELVNAALEKAGLTKRMTSSGVSSETTTALAQRAGAAGSGTLGGAMLAAAKTGGMAGAAISGGIEVVKGVKDLWTGERDAADVAVRVSKAAAKGGVTGMAASAAATGTGAATAAGLALVGAEAGLLVTGATIGLPIVAAVAVGWGATKVLDWIWD